MKGFTIQHSIDLLEKKLDQGSGGGGSSSASQVSYDNTESGLSSTSVQGAIDELDTNVDTLGTNLGTLDTRVDDLEDSLKYSTDEVVVGKWVDNRDIYRKVFEVETAISLQSGLWSDLTGVDNTGMESVLGITIFQYDTGELVCAMPVGGYVGTTVVKALSFRSNTTIGVGSLISVDYIKPVENANTRKRSKK